MAKLEQGNLLEECFNPDCTQCGNKEERKGNSDENDVFCLKVKSVIDGLPMRCVGMWGRDKVTYLRKYVAIASVAMRGKRHVNYIEVCSGPGRCIDRDGQEFNGSPLAVLHEPSAVYLNKVFFFDHNPDVVSTLRNRIQKDAKIPDSLRQKISVDEGDYNENKIAEIVGESISPKDLNIIFIDPCDVSVPFGFYVSFTRKFSNCDFIINFAQYTDINREIGMLFRNPKYKETCKKYARAINDSSFFTNPDNKVLAKQGQDRVLCDKYRSRFIEQFQTLGYTVCDENKKVKYYYYLMFFSKSELAVDFWKKATKKTAAESSGGQRVLF